MNLPNAPWFGLFTIDTTVTMKMTSAKMLEPPMPMLMGDPCGEPSESRQTPVSRRETVSREPGTRR